MPRVDFSVADSNDFEPVPDGEYEAVLTDWALKDGPKAQYYNCEFTLQGNGEPFDNKKVWSILSLSPQALWRFKRDMIRLGADPEDLAPGSEADTDDIVRSVVGAPCRLRLKVETYTTNSGEERQKNTIVEVKAPVFAI